jgi:hypothetical protein
MVILLGWRGTLTTGVQKFRFAVRQAATETVLEAATVAGALYAFVLVPEEGDPVTVDVAEMDPVPAGESVQVSCPAAPGFITDTVNSCWLPAFSGAGAPGDIARVVGESEIISCPHVVGEIAAHTRTVAV